MIRRAAIYALSGALGLAAPALAQAPLTLGEAVERARRQNPVARSAEVSEREAAQRVTQARAGYWPQVDLVESWQRGNQPVFVFSSLLSQRQFTAANFAIDSLNHPAAVDNFRTAVTIEQPVFDGSTRARVAGARIGREMASAGRLVVDHDLAADVTAAYAGVIVAAAGRQSAEAGAARARADRELAGNRRDAGLVTDADVLQLDLHVSRTREQQIRAASDEQVARAQLNQLMGESLDVLFTLEPPAALTAIDTADLGALESEALENRPDLKLAALQERLAATNHAAARAAFLPQVSAQAGWEINGGAWSSRESSWIVGAVARINLFHGFADRARVAEARGQVTRRSLETEQAMAAARLDVRIAIARLDAARAGEAVSRAAVAQADESRRIIRDRYEAGLADVTSLLRASEAVVQSETQQVAAQAAVLTGTAALERALGRR
jgi:outer membrane protein TolC